MKELDFASRYARLLNFVRYEIQLLREKGENERILKGSLTTPVDNPLRNLEIYKAQLSLRAVKILKEIGEL